VRDLRAQATLTPLQVRSSRTHARTHMLARTHAHARTHACMQGKEINRDILARMVESNEIDVPTMAGFDQVRGDGEIDGEREGGE